MCATRGERERPTARSQHDASLSRAYHELTAQHPQPLPVRVAMHVFAVAARLEDQQQVGR